MQIGRRALLAADRVDLAKQLDRRFYMGLMDRENYVDQFLMQTLTFDFSVSSPVWKAA
jgi:hypothetical protein